MNESSTARPTTGFWVISGIALVWNLLGVAAYLMHVSLGPDDFAAMSEAEAALYTDAPSWVTGAYAIAVFGGALGCVGLLLRKAWALPVFVVSMVGILAQMGYSLLVQNTIEVMGASIVIMPLVIIAIGAYLIWFSQRSRSTGVLV
ncbi:MAG: hypothetical protein R3288_07735 [Woeseiaceae bacterium]|nr:hypothetical protein [Woeseiaceae bacterium]